MLPGRAEFSAASILRGSWYKPVALKKGGYNEAPHGQSVSAVKHVEICLQFMVVSCMGVGSVNGRPWTSLARSPTLPTNFVKKGRWLI